MNRKLHRLILNDLCISGSWPRLRSKFGGVRFPEPDTPGTPSGLDRTCPLARVWAPKPALSSNVQRLNVWPKATPAAGGPHRFGEVGTRVGCGAGHARTVFPRGRSAW